MYKFMNSLINFSLSFSQFYVLLHLEFPLAIDCADCSLPVLSLTWATKENFFSNACNLGEIGSNMQQSFKCGLILVCPV